MAKTKKNKKKDEKKEGENTRKSSMKVWVPSERKWMTVEEYNNLISSKK